MVRKFLVSVVALAASSAAFGQITASVVDLGLNDGTYNFDLTVNWAVGDDWTATGVRVDALNGAALAYNLQNILDGNGNPADTTNAGPGTGAPFHTFSSTPLPVGSGGRFNNDYAANLAGSAFPASPTPVRTATEFNVALFDTSETNGDGLDRGVHRTALDVSGVAGFDGGSVYFSQTGPASAGDILVGTLQSGHGARSQGTTLTTLDGEFYATPEPASLALLALGALFIRRR